MDPSTESLVPHQAWLEADRAFDDPDPIPGDELHRALEAAAPLIRLDELDQSIQLLGLVADQEEHESCHRGITHAIDHLKRRRVRLIARIE